MGDEQITSVEIDITSKTYKAKRCAADGSATVR